jgi:Tol biopolymer transport system component
MTMTRLTQLGNVTGCTNISPDGKYVIYCTSEGPRGTLYLRQVAAAAAVKIGETAGVTLTSFSPDGNFVYLAQVPKAGLFELPVLGGEPRRILSDIDGPVAISPDGKQMAFVRFYGEAGEMAILVANRDGSGERRLWAGKMGVSWPSFAVTWSPDGQQLAFGLVGTEGGSHATLSQVEVATGKASALSRERWDGVQRVVWLPDGSGLVFCARSGGGSNWQLWFLSLPDGTARRITNDLNDYQNMSLGVTGDSQTIGTARIEQQSTVYTSSVTGEDLEQFSVGAGPDGADSVQWLPDGRLVYSSTAAGQPSAMVAERGKPPRALTTKDDFPTWIEVSPDGRYIVFANPIGDAQHIFRVDVESGERMQLTHGANNDSVPLYTPDGDWMVFTRLEQGKAAIWKVPAEGGEATRVTGEGFFAGMSMAPDGKTLLTEHLDPETNRPRVALVRVADGGVEKVFDKPKNLSGWRLRFSPDGRAGVYVQNVGDVSNLWSLPLDGGEPRQLTQFTFGRIFFYDFSPDGKRLALGRGSFSGDVVLIKNFK